MYATLQDFLARLEREGELHRVREEVSPILEIAEVADRQSKRVAPVGSRYAKGFDPGHCESGGKALLFERVEGCDFPVAINVFGSYRRMEMALGVEESGGFAAIAERLAGLTKPSPPGSVWEMVGKARELLPLLRTPPRKVRRGICQEVVKLASRGEVDLRRVPSIQCWPFDGDPREVGIEPPEDQPGGDSPLSGGRYVTFAGMHTIHADDAGKGRPGSHNIGMYRAQLIDATRLAMHWHLHHDGAAHWRSWKKKGKPMPLAICFGGESVLPYAATAPMPPGMSELLMAGFLNGRGIPLVAAKTVPLRVPANSEIVIEGYVSTECGPPDFDSRSGEPLGPGAYFEGPFGDHTGYYSLPDRYPIMEVTAITHREKAVFPATIVGLPPQEDYYLGKATERIFLPLLKVLIPDIEDYHLPSFGCFHNCVFVQIRKQYALQARRVMHAVWGAGQMAWTKMIVVVDEEVSVHDEEEVLRAMFEQCVFARDVEMVRGPLDILDHAAPFMGAGGKMGFDATAKVAGEDGGGVSFSEDPCQPGCDLVRDRVEGLGGKGGIVKVAVPEFGGGRCVFLGVEKRAAGMGAEAIELVWDLLSDSLDSRLRGNDGGNSGGDFVVAVDGSVAVEDWEVVFFHLCANTDPGRDVIWRGGRMGIDATAKIRGDERNGLPVRDFPPRLVMDEGVRQRVEDRAGEFGLG